ncbi:SGNH/GDSL hydrolase family protein [Naumannella halotolerans]|uniref:SGNH/GDSL hydrolase family protein n=1 Tax=Naumannella halotolerans TaxID=993414 RepID=UPI00370D61A5
MDREQATDEVIRYAAIGDSFTEGIGDEGPEGPVGWADRVAARLADDHDLLYANFAVRGRRLDAVIDEQVPAALSLDPPPTMITFCAGGNDLLRPRFTPEQAAARVEEVVVRFRRAGVQVVLVSSADPSGGLPMGRLVRARGDHYARLIGDLAARQRVKFVDISHDLETARAQYWSADRLHLNSDGHRRVAALVLRGLGIDPDVEPSVAAPRRRGSTLSFTRRHFAPWVWRRVRGRSSGDGRQGKRVQWSRPGAVLGPGESSV